MREKMCLQEHKTTDTIIPFFPPPSIMVQYDLEDRTERFAADVRGFIAKAPKHLLNESDSKQVIRSSGSVAANYIEANEALSTKDFIKCIKICRKEAKESSLWLRLLVMQESDSLEIERRRLIQEAREFVLIFASILRKTGGIK